MKVYVVKYFSGGAYSIIGIFSTEELAKDACKKFDERISSRNLGLYSDITEYTIDHNMLIKNKKE